MTPSSSYPRLFRPPDGHFFLFGPRGTGKSTWLRICLPDALFVDLLERDTRRRLEAAPERLRDLVAAVPAGRTVVIDEVQAAPALLTEVHRLIEARTGHRFVLTGSSARKLKRSGVDLLAGRAVVERMHPFMACELGDDFDLDRALEVGMVPLVVDANDPSATLAAYAGLYVDTEVRAEGLVRNVGAFDRFLEALSYSHGATLAVAALARECEVPRKTVEGFLGVLEDLLLAFRVRSFTRRARRATVKRDKLYLFDTGVFRSLRPSGPLDRPSEARGPALEGLVAQHLRAWIDHRHADAALYYWRTRGGAEVDLVLYGAECFVAVEVKHAARVHDADIRHLRSFAVDYPECVPLLLHRGSQAERRRGVLCLPVSRFLTELRPQRTLAEVMAAGSRPSPGG